MQYIEPVLYLISGFTILILGGEALIKAAISISVRFEVSPTVIGLTIIAAGTSAPELMTSLLAAFNNTPDIALGNVVGSNIFNILAILGISSIIKANHVNKALAKTELPLLILFSILTYFLISDGGISRFDGITLLLILGTYLGTSIWRSKKNPSEEEPDEDMVTLKAIHWDVIYLFIGFAGLSGGAHLALIGGISIGQLAGLTERVIGITIISVGTGLPELATSAIAAYRGRNDIAIANIIGSNIMNTLAILGVTATVHPIVASQIIISRDIYCMLGGTVLLLPLIFLGKYVLSKASGIILLGSYISYVVYVLNT